MKRKIAILVLTGIITVGGFPKTAMAGNIADIGFHYIFSDALPEAETAPRTKEDTTSTYVKAIQVPGGFVDCKVYGLRSSGWYNETIGGKVRLYKGAWFIKQYVKEHGGSKAKLHFVKGTANGSLEGYWSPDSIGSYPSLN